MSVGELSVAFFLQLFVILGTCRTVGWIIKRVFNQPQVIGDMIAGILLGPSLFGFFAPEIQQLIFPADTKPILYVGAQLGIGLYMFLVGMGFRSDHFRLNARSAVSISLAGVATPFLVAMALTPWLMDMSLFGKDAGGFEASLFLGVAISITAFPVLARIIHERGLEGTPLAALALSAGAIDDAIAWTILAILLAGFDAEAMTAVKAIVGGGMLSAFMLLLAPRLLAPLARWADREGRVTPPLLMTVIMLFALSAGAMDAIGLHAVFGGFLLGVAMPRGILTREVRQQIEPITTALLVPLFFAFSGLNTSLTMVDTVPMLLVAVVILAGSVLAKGGACWAVARMTGQSKPMAMAVGALMNARGLMELLVINIGLQRGIIGPALFAMLVLMTIVTTMMASPLVDIFYKIKDRKDDLKEDGVKADPHNEIAAYKI